MNDKLHGYERWIWSNGKLIFGTSKNGKKDGYFITYKPDGSVDSKEIYENGSFKKILWIEIILYFRID